MKFGKLGCRGGEQNVSTFDGDEIAQAPAKEWGSIRGCLLTRVEGKTDQATLGRRAPASH